MITILEFDRCSAFWFDRIEKHSPHPTLKPRPYQLPLSALGLGASTVDWIFEYKSHVINQCQ